MSVDKFKASQPSKLGFSEPGGVHIPDVLAVAACSPDAAQTRGKQGRRRGIQAYYQHGMKKTSRYLGRYDVGQVGFGWYCGGFDTCSVQAWQFVLSSCSSYSVCCVIHI